MPTNEHGEIVAPLNALRGPTRGKLAIIVTQIRDHTFRMPDDTALIKTYDATVPQERAERDHVWGILTKDARAGYFATAIGQIWDDVKKIRQQMRDQGSDIGLAQVAQNEIDTTTLPHDTVTSSLTPLRSTELTDPLHEVSESLALIFHYAIQQWEIKEQAKDPQDEGYVFLQKLMDFAHSNGSTKIKTPGQRIEHGLISPRTTMPELLKIIPLCFERKVQRQRKITPEEYEHIARNSVGILLHLAAINSEYTPAIEARLQTQEGGWDQYKFILVVQDNTMRIEFNPGFLQKIEDDFTDASFASITEGCSAMTAMDSLGNIVNVIRELWGAYIDVAKDMSFLQSSD